MMQEQQYEDQEYEDQNNYQGLGKVSSKNSQIYGFFYQAYEPEQKVSKNEKYAYRNKSTYSKFKPGDTIMDYDAELIVHIPQAKNNIKKQINSIMQPPKVGKFSLESFMNQQLKNQLQPIQQQTVQNKNMGLTDKIKQKLKLVKIGEQVDQILFQEFMCAQKSQNKKSRRTEKQKEKAREFKEGYGTGFKMMQKMGFKNITKGLGKNQTGLQTPVQAIHKTSLLSKDKPQQQGRTEPESDSSQQQQQQLVHPSEKLFQYYSTNQQINNFLFYLKNQYEKLNSKISFLNQETNHIQSQIQISMSLTVQKKNQIYNINQNIEKLQNLKNNVYQVNKLPHLALHYKIDLLLLKQSYQRLSRQSLQQLYRNFETEISRCKEQLSNFYLSKEQENIRNYNKSIDFEIIFPQKQKQYIQIDDEDSRQKKVQIIEISPQDQKKINQYLHILVKQTVLQKLQSYCHKLSNIAQIESVEIIDLIYCAKKYLQNIRGNCIEQFINSRIKQLFKIYLQNCPLEQKNGLLPHLIILKWANVIEPAQLNLLAFIERISSKFWNIKQNKLFKLISPLLKWCDSTTHHYILHLYLAPRILYQMEQFSLQDRSTKDKISGLIKYCSLLPDETKEDILNNTILPQLMSACSEYRENSEELRKWLLCWEKYMDQICKGYLYKSLQKEGILI